MTDEEYDAIQERRHTAHPIVRQIIDRDCHVAETNRNVIDHVIDRLSDGYATYRAMPKAERRRLLEDCIAVHAANRAEYEAVMWPRYETPAPSDP
jgi:hypothetical protein